MEEILDTAVEIRNLISSQLYINDVYLTDRKRELYCIYLRTKVNNGQEFSDIEENDLELIKLEEKSKMLRKLEKTK